MGTDRRRLGGVVTLVAAFGLVSPLAAAARPGVAGAATGGPANITAVGSLTPLHSGGSATPFGLALPVGASCPGDSAHEGYRVDSYLVPKGESPVGVNFRNGLPSRGYGYYSDGAYFGAVNTAQGSGEIVGIPNSFAWSRLTPEQLLPGGTHSATWEGGIACADVHGDVTSYWNNEIVFTADSADPGGFTWRVVDEGPLPSPSDATLWIGIGLLIVASLAAAYALHARRQGGDTASGSPTPDQEDDDDPAGDVRPVVGQHSG